MIDKKQLFVIKPHSIIDVITNSSTELFVGTTNKTKEFIEEIIKEYLVVYNKANNTHYNIENILTVTVIDKSNAREWASEILDWEKPYYLKSSYQKRPDYDDYRTPKGNVDWEAYDLASKKWENNISNNISEDLINEFIGNVVIQGTEDNSIPYTLFDLIENLFTQSCRIHQG